MREILALPLVLLMFCHCSIAQTGPDRDYTSPPQLCVHFLLNDFTTPQRIRSTSLTSVFQNHQLAKVKEMYPGIGITYYQGLKNHIDFTCSLYTSFVSMQLAAQPRAADNKLLLEASAAANFKLLTDHYIIDPFLTVGIGASKYSVYYGAFMPIGAGIKINFFDEAALILSTQYRVPVTTETANYHFVHSIGIAGVLRAKKQ